MIYTKKDLRLKLKAKNKLLASYQEQLDELKRENQRLKNKIFFLEHPKERKEVERLVRNILSVGQ